MKSACIEPDLSPRHSSPVTAEEVTASLASQVTDTRRQQVSDLLETLAALSQARKGEDGRWGGG